VPPIPIHEDNEACIAQIQREFVRTDATKHINPMHHSWLQQEQGKTIQVRPVRSMENTADIFTKALPSESHWRHLKGLGLKSLRDVKGDDQSQVDDDQANG
jgi:hypothetical protein